MTMGQGNPADIVKAWSPRDWMVVAGGVVAFIFSLFDYVGAKLPFVGSVSISAWHSYAILGLLLVFAASVTWALRSLKIITLPPLPAKYQVISAGASGLGTLLLLLRGVTYPSPIGLEFGGIVLIIAGLVVTAGAVWSLQLGEQIGTVAPLGKGSQPPAAPPGSWPGSGFPQSGSGVPQSSSGVPQSSSGVPQSGPGVPPSSGPGYPPTVPPSAPGEPPRG
jgi:hypothetical protein